MSKSPRRHDVPRTQDEQDLHKNSRVESYSSGWGDLVKSGFMSPHRKRPEMTEDLAFNICLEVTFIVRSITEQHAALRGRGMIQF